MKTLRNFIDGRWADARGDVLLGLGNPAIDRSGRGGHPRGRVNSGRGGV